MSLWFVAVLYALGTAVETVWDGWVWVALHPLALLAVIFAACGLVLWLGMTAKRSDRSEAEQEQQVEPRRENAS